MKLFSALLSILCGIFIYSCQSEDQFLSEMYSFCSGIEATFPDSLIVGRRDSQTYLLFDSPTNLVCVYRRGLWEREYKRDPEYGEGKLSDECVIPFLNTALSLHISGIDINECIWVWATRSFQCEHNETEYVFVFSKDFDSNQRQNLLIDRFRRSREDGVTILSMGSIDNMSWIVIPLQTWR